MATRIEDFSNTTLTVVAHPPQLLAATSTAYNRDMLLGDGNCWCEIAIGTFNGTTLTVQIQQSSATSAGMANISGASVSITTNSPNVYKFNFQRDLRYLAAVATVSGTTIGISTILGEQLKQL